MCVSDTKCTSCAYGTCKAALEAMSHEEIVKVESEIQKLIDNKNSNGDNMTEEQVNETETKEKPQVSDHTHSLEMETASEQKEAAEKKPETVESETVEAETETADTESTQDTVETESTEDNTEDNEVVTISAEQHARALSSLEDKVQEERDAKAQIQKNLEVMKKMLQKHLPDSYSSETIMSSATAIVDGFDAEKELAEQDADVLQKFVAYAESVVKATSEATKNAPKQTESASAGAEETEAPTETETTGPKYRFGQISDRIERAKQRQQNPPLTRKAPVRT